VGFEGRYSISNTGEVRSDLRVIERSDGKTQRVYPRNLKPAADRKGYLYVNLWRDNIGATCYIHQLVLRAFVGPCPDGQEIRHLDGNSMNNRLDNLQYGTRSENFLDTVRHGTHRNAKKTHCPQGHPYDEANTYIGRKKNGGYYRKCKECQRIRLSAWHLTALRDKL
jgi:hypothetical protein